MGRDAGGASLSDHYEAMIRSGRMQRPKPPELPEEAAHVWQCFRDISRARSYHGAGPNPISFCDIEAYTRLMEWPLDPWEVEAIRRLDEAYFASRV